MHDNIVLIGFMGSGKTFTARALAQLSGFQWVDTDDLIVQQLGCPITEIFKQFGEKYFRDQETQLCEDLHHYSKTVIATGGGIVTRKENRDALKRTGMVFWLKTNPKAVFERLKHKTDRPLLQVADLLAEIERLMAVREAWYQESAHVVLDADALTIQQLAETIWAQFNSARS